MKYMAIIMVAVFTALIAVSIAQCASDKQLEQQEIQEPVKKSTLYYPSTINEDEDPIEASRKMGERIKNTDIQHSKGIIGWDAI